MSQAVVKNPMWTEISCAIHGEYAANYTAIASKKRQGRTEDPTRSMAFGARHSTPPLTCPSPCGPPAGSLRNIDFRDGLAQRSLQSIYLVPQGGRSFKF